MNYIAKYRCRYCGEEFRGAYTGKSTAIETIVEMSFGKHLVQGHGIPLSDKEIHYDAGVGGHLGLGDFIGFEIEEE